MSKVDSWPGIRNILLEFDEQEHLFDEREQIVMAIDYFERQLETEFSAPHAEKTKKTIKKLNAQLKELQRK